MVSVASALEATPVRRYCSGTWGDMGRYGGDVRRCGGGMGRYGEIRGDMGTCSVTERSSMVSATTALLRALCFRPSALLIWQGSGSGSGSDLGSGLGAG